MIDLNIKILTDLSLRFIESLKRHQGKILNVASIAAFLPGPNMAVYYASKAYVLSFSQALSHELKSHNIQVSTLCPGPVPTGFQNRAGINNNTAPSILTLDATTTAEITYQHFMRGKKVIIPGLGNKIFTRLVRFIPTQWLMTKISKYQSGRM